MNIQKLQDILRDLDISNLVKIVFHSPKKGAEFKKIVGRAVLVKGQAVVQFEQFTQTQAFHKNVALDEFCNTVLDIMNDFDKFEIYSTYKDYFVICKQSSDIKIRAVANHLNNNSNDNSASNINNNLNSIISNNTQQNLSNTNLVLSHNKQKKYVLPQGVVVPPLVDLGVFDKQGKVINSKYDKFKQINKFVELVHDVVKNNTNKKLSIVDFGCGKSYLSFIVYYYLTEIAGFEVDMVGLDLKADVVENCNKIAQKYDYKGLKFVAQDIKDFVPNGDIDIVISLHACDTATDYALFNAIKWGAKSIICVPCCQHELFAQMRLNSILLNHGIVKERIAALLTDSIRANVLTLHDYNSQILEFVDLAHSPKNLCIRATKSTVSPKKKEQAKQEIDQAINEYKVSPTICRLCNVE